MIFALYLGLPIVSSALRYFIAQKSHTYLYILAFCVIFFGTVIPTCTQLLAWSPVHFNITSVLQMNIFGTDVWGASVWILYLLLGFILKRFSSSIERIATWVLIAVFIVAFALKSLLHICAWKSNFASDPYYANLALVISAAALFPLLHRIFKFSSDFSQKLIPLNAQFSKLSFGVYMIHVWLYDLSMSLLAKPPINMANQYMVFLICLLVSYFGSVLIAKLLSLVPVARKWLLLMK
ncbi:hypothetical protein OZX57_07910 [Bifidobacterium sp. ESL0682]|uniref:hypothetical protein n=1 Tax=Bifidobacterium sp. ESL0682 TaxID=2983212 RepID=UPI0023F7A39F|nr:hypothetical protein [Bifidobacterium sp. ESL0682]WEV41853.1 hypothetical protein OZX57_07910 [Bifidobacterium sp. ESL0682]